MRYHVYLEGEPTLESYRLSHQPWADYAPVFICPFVVVTDGSGRLYNAMRGIQGQSKNETMNMGVYRLDGRLDDQCPVLFPYSENPIAERFRITESADAVSYVGDTWRFDFGVDRYRWADWSGRLELTARRLGQVCTFWFPEQEGYEYPQMLRSHLGKATGTLAPRRPRPHPGLGLGTDASLVLAQAGSTDWPLHTCGTVVEINRDKPIAKSWNYTEFFLLNWHAVADYQAAHLGLFGRYPSFARLMRDARIVDQRLVFQ